MKSTNLCYLLTVNLVFLATIVLCGDDFYQLLGITRSATQRDIRRAFKRLALEKHPDKRGVSNHATKLFLQ